MGAELYIQNLNILFGDVAAVKNLTLRAKAGSFLALVGESGSGKSQTALALGGLQPKQARIQADQLRVGSLDLQTITPPAMRAVLGDRISYIFQEPMTALNPVLRIRTQMRELVSAHRKMSGEATDQLCLSWLRKVQIPDAERIYRAYPHELSGGLRQRVMIAMALCLNPELLVADEPTTALDVTVQKEILDLLRTLQAEQQTTVLFITHDLDVVAAYADEVAVMYAGTIVEFGGARKVLAEPQHPYTQGLLASSPNRQRREQIVYIPGRVQARYLVSTDCAFRERCPKASTQCLVEPLFDGKVSCHHPLKSGEKLAWSANVPIREQE